MGTEITWPGFPGGSDGKKFACDGGDPSSIPESGRSPGEGRKWQPTPVFSPGKAQGQRSLGGYSPWSQTRLSDFTFTFQVEEPACGQVCLIQMLLLLPLPLKFRILDCFGVFRIRNLPKYFLFSSQSTGKTFYGAGELGIGLFSHSFFFFLLCWVFIAARRLSLAVVWGLLALRSTGSRIQAHYLRCSGFVAPWHVESSWTRDQTHVPCFGRQILNHWTTGKFFLFFNELLGTKSE